MARPEGNPAGRDGVDGNLLEADMEYFGAGRIRTAASERARSEGGAWPKDGPERLPMDSGFAQARVATEQFCATTDDSGFAGSDTDAGDSDARAHFSLQPDSEGLGGCQHQVGVRSQRCVRRVGTVHIAGTDER